MAANLTPEQLAWLRSQASQAQSMPGSIYNGGVFTDPTGQTFTDQRQGGWQGGEAGFDSGPGVTTGYMRDVTPGQHRIGDMQDVYGADGTYKNTAAVKGDDWLDKLMPLLLAGAGVGIAGGLMGGAGAAGGASGSGAAGAANGMWDVLPEAAGGGGGAAGGGSGLLSKAALDGTTAFGANSAPGAFELSAESGGGLLGGGPNTASMGAGPGPGASLGQYAGPEDLNGLNGSDVMSDTFDKAGGFGKGGFGGTDGSFLGSLFPNAKSPGLGLVSTALGGLLGSKPQTKNETTTKDIPQWLRPYVEKNLGYASGLLDKQMAPGYLQGYDDMRAKGQGLLNQPIAGNGFNKFFPGR